MNKRLPVGQWATTRKKIIARDDHACKKCGRSQPLEVHHIIAVSQGGTNDEENLITLCLPCHRDWELVEIALVTPFEEWLALPPLLQLFTIYKSKHLWEPTLSAEKMHDTIEQYHKERRENKID